MTLPVVFVCYSHQDDRETAKLYKFLTQFKDEIEFELWSDHRLDPGDEWEREIDAAIARADFALLVISVDFLHSTFINEFELPRIFARRDEGRLKVFPLVLKPCYWEGNRRLKPLQVWPKGGAVYPCPRAHEARELNRVAAEVARVVRGLGGPTVLGRARQNGRALSLFVLAASIFFFASYFTYRRSLPGGSAPPFNVSLYSSPLYLSPDEAETLNFAVKNTGRHSRSMKLRLESDGSGPCVPGTDKSNLFWSGVVEGLEETHPGSEVLCSWRAEHTFAPPPKSAGLRLEGQVGEDSFEPIKLPLKIAPLPRLKLIWYVSLLPFFSCGLYLAWAWSHKSFPKYAAA